MVLLRMLAFRPDTTEKTVVKRQDGARPAPPSDALPKTDRPQLSAEPPKSGKEPMAVGTGHTDWADMIAAMKLTGFTRELANNCVLAHLDDTVCNLILDEGHKHLRRPASEENLQKALQTYRGAPLKLVINAEKTAIATPALQQIKDRENRQQAAIEAINSDDNIQALKEHFDARIMPGTIEPV